MNLSAVNLNKKIEMVKGSHLGLVANNMGRIILTKYKKVANIKKANEYPKAP